MKHLILSFGARQSGKTTSATAIYGYYLTSKGVIPNCNIDPNGRMSVIYDKETKSGIYFDIDDDSPEMISFKKNNIWTHIKHVSFADALKESIIRVFSIKREWIYGSDEDKNRLTHIKWEDAFRFMSPLRVGYVESRLRIYEGMGLEKPKFLTIRELCQVFGSDICRELDPDCHVRSAETQLIIDDPDIGCSPDGRFENEFEYFDKPEVKERLKNTKIWKIKYTRNASPDNVPGEQGLPGIDESRYDLVVDNRSITVLEKNDIVINFFIEQGVLPKKGITKVS